jgi:hypothetical protein
MCETKWHLLYIYIYNIENRKNCWDALKNLLKANNNTRKLVLQRQLYNLQLEEGTLWRISLAYQRNVNPL